MMRKIGNRTMLSRDGKPDDIEVKKRMFCPLYSNRMQELVREYEYHRKRVEELLEEIEKEKKYGNK